jgi:hypothetical protein
LYRYAEERPARAEAALAKRAEERSGENAPPVVVVKEVKGAEEPITLEPEKRWGCTSGAWGVIFIFRA